MDGWVDRCDLGGWIGKGCRWVGGVGEWTGGLGG